MELEYLLLRRVGMEETMAIPAMVTAWPIQVQESTEEWHHQAAMVKARTSLSVMDACIASLALLHQAELVHKDPEFANVTGLPMKRLPYKV